MKRWRIVRSIHFGKSGFVQARLYRHPVNDNESAEISFHAPMYYVQFFQGPHRGAYKGFETYEEARDWTLAVASLELT